MKKYLAMLLAGALSVSLLAGCGGSNGSDSAASNAGSASNGSADQSSVIKIGGIGPLTGSAAVYGIATKTGAQVAVDEINALGGLQFALDFQDDEGDAEKAVNAYNNLKGKGMQVLYGTTTTTPCVAVAAETFNDRIFQLTPSASSTKVTEGRDNVFQACFTDPNQGKAAADYIKEHQLGTKVAAIYNNGDPYSTGIFNAFQAEAQEIGLEVVSASTFPDDTNADFTVQLGEAQKAGADLVFMPIYYTPASLILNQAKTMGYEPTFFGCDGMDGILAIEGFDTSLAEGLMLLTPFAADAKDEKTQAFVTAYEEAYGDTPNQFAADAYDVVYAIYQAALAGNINGDMDASDICEALKTQFSSMTFDGLTGDGMTWDASGAVSKAPKAVVIKDGAYAAM